MAENLRREIPIAQGQFVFVRDRTKGFVNVVVGPQKVNLSESEEAVVWDQSTRGFNVVNDVEKAVRPFITVNDGEYVIVVNPTNEKVEYKSPPPGGSSQPVALDIGKSIILHGPRSFPIWPMQEATVVGGHRLRSNQFVVVEITDQTAAATEWEKATGKKFVPPAPAEGGPRAKVEEGLFAINPDTLQRGQRFIVKGTELPLFLPVTGMKVVKTDEKYVQDAVTLEQLEYCILLDEDGEKDFVVGPAVVFPSPTQTFVQEEGSRVFRAMELTSASGVHVKVTADYKESAASDAKTIKAGTELFITGDKQAIYFPRKEHAIIDYTTVDSSGASHREKIHYAYALPEGHGRYVLNKLTGDVQTVIGPKMLLLNPAEEVFVQRVLADRQVKLWFPGNESALTYNRSLAQSSPERLSTHISAHSLHNDDDMQIGAAAMRSFAAARPTGVGEGFSRPSTYTAPKSIQLDDRFTGAVTINVYQGFAIQVVSRSGTQRVEVGPKSVLLGYDDELTALSLSTGKPKTTDKLFETAYLQIMGNQVSDVVTVSTSDHIEVSVKIAYQVTFAGEQNRWFNVPNYVKQICDHYRSKLRGVAKQHNILTFITSAVDIIRDAVVGKKQDENTPRLGRMFDENGVKVYDCEVLDVSVKDPSIANQLALNQRQVMERTLTVTLEEIQLGLTRRSEKSKRETVEEKSKTAKVESSATLEVEENREELELRKIEALKKTTLAGAQQQAELELEKSRAAVKANELRKLSELDLLLLTAEETAKRQKVEAEAETALNEVKRQTLELTLAQDKLKTEQMLALEKMRTDQAQEVEKAKHDEQERLEVTRQERQLALVVATTAATKERLSSVTPDLAKALSVGNDNKAMTEIAESLGIAAFVKNDSLGATLSNILQGSALEDGAKRLLGGLNGGRRTHEAGV